MLWKAGFLSMMNNKTINEQANHAIQSLKFSNREYGNNILELSRLIPENIPISLARIKNCVPQTIGDRKQLLSPDGSFVLTDIDKLPAGGSIDNHAFNQSLLEIFILGDMGLPGQHQASVTKSVSKMINSSSEDRLSLILGVGDWVYPTGPRSLEPSERHRVVSSVLSSYQPLAKNSQVIDLLGNHEYGDSQNAADPEAFITLAQEYGIDIPSRYFVKSYVGKDYDLHILCLDSSTILSDKDQVAWAERIVNSLFQKKNNLSNKSQWIVLAMHQPYESYGYHKGETLFLKEVLINILPKVDVCLSGHEHDLEYISKQERTPPQVISGTASTLRTPIDRENGTIFNVNMPGFAKLIANKKELKVEFHHVDTQNNVPPEIISAHKV